MDIRVKTKAYEEALKLHVARCKGRERERLEDQAVEEMGELQAKIMQRRRDRGSDTEILFEIADVILDLYALVPHLSEGSRQHTAQDLNNALVIKTEKWLSAELSGKEPKMSGDSG